ncbi:hypothetical protein P3X46_028486 [Hevea brasiliensis]|uniref:PsbP C-terminal domain-containing protein n=1 Tax=Hevea brasiliensis TaxID=3981 RepID=A0ABQ9KP96_HEVBR|nr:psbP domain-containing protein 4, chloroplastic [Hevea brasiliensis]KAJ9146185.1 hypothetical protein P3X46_028486 [Hevea brasiliensis]
MGTTLFTSCSFPWSWRFHHQLVPCSHLLAYSSQESGISRAKATAEPRESGYLRGENEKSSGFLKRRSVLVSGISMLPSAVFGYQGEGLAAVKQGLLAGRIPGLSQPDEEGWRTYRRPDDKSGGHGVGWSPIIPYAFVVPQDWEEVPVSIADLGGTEIDLRFASSKEGRLFVIVAPVLRFADNLGGNASIELIGPPEKVINAFGPEVIGENVEGRVQSINVAEHSGRMYYQYELEPPHVLITATAAGNRLYLFAVTGSGLQWKRHYKDLKRIAESFRVV